MPLQVRTPAARSRQVQARQVSRAGGSAGRLAQRTQQFQRLARPGMGLEPGQGIKQRLFGFIEITAQGKGGKPLRMVALHLRQARRQILAKTRRQAKIPRQFAGLAGLLNQLRLKARITDCQ
ncbi:hypothetical protein SAMN05216600_103272 [Pseudomonas cuatrocienegasensis]|uniref:Uncharacterized protein n=1 Tax=Pseudomonas cuatrocienegasensis TaxID=543360 RepID=A0ABY1B6T7_9PSED|nr:hypothetical protein SAMN05216600_103272 [Pseudomonas cuatrocienegasensis]